MKYLITFLLIPAIWSCNTQKHTQSSEVKTVQAAKTVSDSTKSVRTDNVQKVSKDSSKTVSHKINDSSVVNVTFNGGTTDKPIVIQDSAGKTIIDAGGRNVTHVSVKKSKTKSDKQTQNAKITDSSSVKKDSATKIVAVVAKKAITDTKTSKTDKVSKVSFLARFGLYFIALIVVVLAWLVIKYWTKIKSWIPWI